MDLCTVTSSFLWGLILSLKTLCLSLCQLPELYVSVFLPHTIVLQLAGRNPSLKTLSKYWTPATSNLNFDDFCEILKLEKQTDENELLRIFKGMDINGDGFISHSELEKALTTVSSHEHLQNCLCVSLIMTLMLHLDFLYWTQKVPYCCHILWWKSYKIGSYPFIE